MEPLTIDEAMELARLGKRTVIKQTTLANGRYVSTIHIPVLEKIGGPYEIMVFPEGSGHELDYRRAKTVEQALKIHARLSAKWS